MDRNKIELIEDLPFEPDDQVYILLVAYGDKPAAWVHLASEVWREGEDEKKISDKLLDSIFARFDQLGLKYEFSRRITAAGLDQSGGGRRRFWELYDIYIARDTKSLTTLVDARKRDDNKKLGIALGYPPTAVEAFETASRMSTDDLPIKERLSESAQFTGFMLSRENWRDELNRVEEQVGIVKGLSPIIYHAYINAYFEVSPALSSSVIEKLASRPK